jgi:hypothetical protein
MPGDVRDVAGYVFSLVSDNRHGDATGSLHVGIGGTKIGNSGAGTDRLFLQLGDDPATVLGEQGPTTLVGRIPLKLRTWYHVALVVDGKSVTLYLDDQPQLEAALDTPLAVPAGHLYLGGPVGDPTGRDFAGLIGEVAVRRVKGEE